jgi:hypothetical protein
VDVPDGWTYQEAPECVTLEPARGKAAFQISAHRKDTAVTDDDLREFAGDIPLAAVALPNYTGIRTRFSDDDAFWIKWWLRAGPSMVHVTYNCTLGERGKDDEDIDSLMRSLKPLYGTQEV